MSGIRKVRDVINKWPWSSCYVAVVVTASFALQVWELIRGN